MRLPTIKVRPVAWALAAVMLCLIAGCTPPPPVPAPMAVTPDRILELTINFDFDSHRIRPDSYAALDNLAMAMNDRRLAGYHFDINGHTDITGRLAYNIALSILRAEAVVDYLASRGVPRDVMRAQGFGPLQLLDPANPRSGVNRRVEIVSIR